MFKIYIKSKYLLLYLILILYQNIYANENNQHSRFLPKNKPIPGGVAIVPLDLPSIQLPIVFFNNKQVLVIKYNDILCETHQSSHADWIAVIAIPMEAKPGIHKISIYLNNDDNFEDHLEKSFIVSPAKYPEEKLKMQEKFVTPSYADQIRINKEKKLISNAFNHRSMLLPNLKLKMPIIGRKSSPFGLKRILNGKHRGFHSGIDLAAPTGTKVYAAGTGQVILTGNFFYIGYAVFIDHGQGLITNYSHLDSINVVEGDQVDPTTLIGTVGATGRSTGPHLHWAVSLNDVRVNPELFIE